MFKNTSITASLPILAFVLALGLPHKAAANSNSLIMQSAIALIGVKANLHEDSIFALARLCRPGVQLATVRTAYLSVLLSSIVGAEVLVNKLTRTPNLDYEVLGWKMGEFLAGYFGSHFYFNQPRIPGQH